MNPIKLIFRLFLIGVCGIFFYEIIQLPSKEDFYQTVSNNMVTQHSDQNTTCLANEYWQDPKTSMDFIQIPGGCFQMGSPQHEIGRHSDEGPIHEVCLNAFYLGRYEVTIAQFRLFIDQSNYQTDAEKQQYAWCYNGEWIKKKDFYWNHTGFDQTDAHPVINVSWNDAQSMANWMSTKTHRFRLPTEEEWEFACRGKTDSSRFWGEISDQACTFSNVADQTAINIYPAWTVHSCHDGYIYTAPVGSYQPNPFGLFDMMGNVWELCLNSYDSKGYTLLPYSVKKNA